MQDKSISSKRSLRLMSSVLSVIFLLSFLSFSVFADPSAISCLSVSDSYDYSADTVITASWPGHANVEFTFTNTGSRKIDNWNFIFDTPYVIENIWNGQITDSNGNGTYTVSGPNWNRDIEPGASVTVGMTLSSPDGSDITELPTRFILNTEKEAVDPESYSITYTEYSRWEDGFTGVITIRATETIEDWSLSALASEEIVEASGAVLSINDSGRTVLSNTGDVQDIPDNGSVSIQIRGINTTGYFELTDIVMATSKRAYSLSEDNDGNGIADYLEAAGLEPTVTPTPTETPTPEPTVTIEPTVTDIPEPTVTTEPTATTVPTITEEPTATPEPSLTEAPVPTVTAEPTVTDTPTPTEEPLPTDIPTPTPTPTEEEYLTDTDNDGIPDILEEYMGYNPNLSDSNGNGITDGQEDYDNDGLINIREIELGTFISEQDSDNDKLTDGEETDIYGTDPLNCDTDEDGVRDNEEVWIGKDPNDPADGEVLITQTVSGIINNPDDRFIASVDITMAAPDYLDYDVYVDDLYNIDMGATGIYGRLGSPLGLNSYIDFDTATVTLHYNEDYLGNTNEEDLGLLWYDEEHGIYIEQEQATVDTENNTISVELTHFSTYVPIDRAKWNDATRQPAPEYIVLAQYDTMYIAWKDREPSLEYMERDSFVWWSLSERYHYEIVQTIKADYGCPDEGNNLEHWYYDFEWIVIASDDEDDDGVPDIFEEEGILGTDNRIHKLDPESIDTDGDGIPDGEELGTIWSVLRLDEDKYQVFIGENLVYDETSYDDLDEFEKKIVDRLLSMAEVGQSAQMAIILSDPNREDTDGDGVPDPEDGAPKRVNGLINYLIVGQDNPGESQVDECADYYRYLLEEEHSPYYRVRVNGAVEFFDYWQRLSSYHGSIESEDKLARYSGVDNLIVVCHGSPSTLSFRIIDEKPDGLSIEKKYPVNDELCSDIDILGLSQSIHVNVIDLQACNCANEDGTFGKYNIAFELLDKLDVNEVYAWDTECCFETSSDKNYYTERASDGYVKYYIDNGVIYRMINIDFLCFYLLLNVNTSSGLYWWFRGYVTPKIHSHES